MEEKEFVYLPKSVAASIKEADSIDAQLEIVKKVIENKKKDITADIEMLSDNVLTFKHICLTHKKALDEVYQEQADKLYSLWEETGDISTMISRHAKKVAEEIDPIRREVRELQKSISEFAKLISAIDTHRLEQLFTLVTKIANADEETNKIIGFLVKNYSQKI